MLDSDFTLTSPLSDPGVSDRPLLALTIVWHPDPARIGEQYVGDAGTLELNRYAPQFCRPGQEGLPLGHGGISREPLRFTRRRDDEVTIVLPASRMTVELNGLPVTGELHLDAGALAAGQILTLGRAVVLCLHWMNCLPKDNPVAGLAGVGSAAIALRDQVRMVAPTELTVLLLGETGTGKEIAARGIHALGLRRTDRLVAVNMAALNESLAAADLFGAAKGAYTGAQAERRGLFAEADGATLFLDEIGNAPASVQPMLLRVLEGGDYRPLGAAQDRQSTARLIAATDQDLDSAAFNQALLRRLEGFTIQLPPLRARREDIGVLIVHLLAPQGALPPLTARLVTEIACYDWPGNIRQLAHVLKRIALLVQNGGTPQLEQLVRMAPVPPSSVARLVAQAAPVAPPVAPPAAPTAAAETRRKPSALNDRDVLDAMVASDWNIQAAARMLGISRPSLYKLLDGHGEIRWAERIPAEEIARAMAEHKDDVAGAASALKTPTESLRREVRRSVV
jgi:two-component system nitrogen regulation response regulator GlnG